MSKTLVYAVHGFLGQDSDWDKIKNELSEVEFLTPNLFGKKPKEISLKNDYQKKIFLGYSLGGRLGLQKLKKNPHEFDHYIFLSTGSGLAHSAAAERKLRIENDQKWAEKITEKNWETFLKEWNSQSIFNGSIEEPVRDLAQYDLGKLQSALMEWSLGKQEDFVDLIRENQKKITWVVGDRDQKYGQIAESLKLRNALQEYVKVESGHRIWLDNPDSVVEVINQQKPLKRQSFP